MSMYQSLHRVKSVTIKKLRPVSDSVWTTRLEIEFGSYNLDHSGSCLEISLFSDEPLEIDMAKGVTLGP